MNELWPSFEIFLDLPLGMISPTGPTAILTGSAAMTAFKGIHPLIIEGMGAYDPRDPSLVASRLASALKPRLDSRLDGTKPVLLITQGDPLAERGISAITRALASELNVQRGLVVLDAEVADYHTRDADRENTILELKYSELLEYVDEERIEAAVDEALGRKNNDRLGRGEKEVSEAMTIVRSLPTIVRSLPTIVRSLPTIVSLYMYCQF